MKREILEKLKSGKKSVRCRFERAISSKSTSFPSELMPPLAHLDRGDAKILIYPHEIEQFSFIHFSNTKTIIKS